MDDDRFDELLRALAHTARRAIVRRCTGTWVAAGTLSDELDLSPATVSEHLKVLRKTGLVELRIDGRWRLYRTRPEQVATVTAALETLTPQPSHERNRA